MQASAIPASPLRAIAADIKIAHSVFALPFAVFAAFLAQPIGGLDWRTFGFELALIVIAMVFARTFAMLANRLLDRNIDAGNPRTQGRALPSGRLSVRAAVTALAASAAAFMVVCAGFLLVDGNPWPLILGIPVLAWIGAYGLFKRWTWLCHLYLGSSLAISPLAAAIAVEPAALADPAVWWLSALVLTWVAGFDVIYALQDIDVDRRDGLHSIPARFGPRGARALSLALHVVAFGALIMVGRSDVRLGSAFLAATVIVGVLLAIEHATVARWGTTKIALTFFTLNGIISCVLGVVGAIDAIG